VNWINLGIFLFFLFPSFFLSGSIEGAKLSSLGYLSEAKLLHAESFSLVPRAVPLGWLGIRKINLRSFFFLTASGFFG
jgi:hypothetical protein